jgi:protease I
MRKICFLVSFLLLSIILTGCWLGLSKEKKTKTQPEVNNMSQETGKKILMVVAPRDFRDEEYFQPRDVFDEAGFEVVVASVQSGQARSAAGKTITIDKTVSEVNPADYDAVVFVGGPGMAQIVDDESLSVLAQKFYQEDKIVAAICVAPAILAQAGLVDGKQATSWSGVRDKLEQAGAKWQDEPVVVDGKIITGSGPQAAMEFGQTVRDEILAE